ncbi:MAG: c-type cytochrome [Chthoniobacterales bacterium]|nr:c-type cytochrome [Chthoniobacterales bacterium]
MTGVGVGVVVMWLLAVKLLPVTAQTTGSDGGNQDAISRNAEAMLAEGKQTFRFDTFGSEAFWGDTLKLHEAVAQLSPRQALELGLKVDVDALPAELIEQIKRGEVDLDDPANTILLLKLKSVVGVTGFFSSNGKAKSIGIQCALCHSTVDDTLAPGIGHRLDAWPNRDLNIGAIVATAPDLTAYVELLRVPEETVRQVLNSWGPGKFDAQLLLDGKAFRPDGKPAATLIPPAFGLTGVNNHTWTGSWGNVTYWNAFVANLEMNGQGTFFDPRLDDAEKYPIAARERFGHKRDPKDLITAKLPALQFYQLAIPTPKPPPNSFNRQLALRGERIFNNKANCASCHVPPIFTEPGWNLHKADEIGIDDFQASRAPDNRYRTEPLRALFDTKKIHKGGFYHDGRFATLLDVVNHYDTAFGLGLTDEEKTALVEYLKSI